MARKSRKDASPLVVAGAGQDGRAIQRVLAPWPEWNYDISEEEKRTYNLSRDALPELERVCRDFNEILYLMRFEHPPTSFGAIYRSVTWYLRFLGVCLVTDRPASVADISFESLMLFVNRTLDKNSNPPFEHHASAATVIGHARCIRRVVRAGWSRGVLTGTVRPTLTGVFPAIKGGNVAETEKPYSEGEYRAIVRAVAAVVKEGRGEGKDSELMYLAACACVFFIYFPVNKQGVLMLNEDSLRPTEKENEWGQIRFIKNRPKKKAHHHLLKKDSEAPEAAGYDVKRGKNLVRRIFDENRGFNSTVATEPNAERPLLLWFFPGRGNKGGKRARLTTATLDEGFRLIEKKFKLRHDTGSCLRITPRRLRKTYTNQLSSDVSLETKAKVMRHSHVDTTATSYVVVSDDDHYRFYEGMNLLGAAIVSDDERILIAANAAGVSPEVLQRLKEGLLRTTVASCTDPKNGKYAPKNGNSCRKKFTCFHCPNLAVLKDDLYRLASLRRRIQLDASAGTIFGEAREYFLAIADVISSAIFPKFERRHVRQAEKMAEKQLHPLWIGPTLEM